MAYQIALHAEQNAKSPDAVSSGVQKSILYGEDIRKNPIPAVQPDAFACFPGKDGTAFTMSAAQLSRMTLLIGGNGYGKSNVFSFAIHDILRNMTEQDCMIIFDSKGDSFEQFYEKDNEKHIVVGTGQAYRSCTKYWNIYDELRNDSGEFDEESELLAKELLRQIGKSYRETSQPFFPMAAAEIIAWVIIAYLRDAKYTNDQSLLNNATLVRFLRTATLETYEKMIMTSGNEDMVAVRQYLGTGQKTTGNQGLGVFAFIHQFIDALFIGIFGSKGRTKDEEFSVRQLLKERNGRVLFLEYDISRGELLTPVYRTLIDLSLKKAMGGRSKAKGSFYLITDEFRLTPQLQHAQDAENFGRSLGIKIIAGIQSIHQLADAYGEHTGKVLTAGFTNWICFNTPDFDTRRMISERFGTAYYNLHFNILGRPKDVQKEGFVVEDYDILELDVGEAWISLAGCAPFRFAFERYEDVYPD